VAKRVRRSVSAADKSEMPGFIKPLLATLKSKAPAGPLWCHEIKFDGLPVASPPEQGEAGRHPSISVLKSSGIRGAAPSSGMLQTGQGMPAPLQSQAFERSQGLCNGSQDPAAIFTEGCSSSSRPAGQMAILGSGLQRIFESFRNSLGRILYLALKLRPK
jgi:hypothetical protein